MQFRYSLYIVFILSLGCNTKNNITPDITKFRQDQIDWIAVYQREIKIAQENQDMWAIIFFREELNKEYEKLKKSDR